MTIDRTPKIFTATPALIAAFERGVIKKDGCWGWCGSKHKNGYGILGRRKARVLAHRFSYVFHIGPILPEGRHLP